MQFKPNPKFNGPIPGESLTADTRNYPWHRPPEVTNYNEAVTRVINDVDEDRELQLIYSLLKLEIPVALVTSNLLMRKISRGIIAIDLAILMAGPVARYIEILAKDNGLPADMDTSIPGVEPITPTMLKLQMGSVEDIKDTVETEEEEVEPAGGDELGLMQVQPLEDVVASPEEQASMLGMREEEEEEIS